MTKSLTEKNKEVAEWLGYWHTIKNLAIIIKNREIKPATCLCGKKFCTDTRLERHIEKENPNFVADPLSLLRLMSEKLSKRDFEDFLIYACNYHYGNWTLETMARLILNTTGKLLEAVWEWKEKQK